MKSIDWKKLAPYLVALVVFIGFAVLYCSPILSGKVVYAGDTMNWLGGAHQTQEFRAQTGEDCWWTNSMFSGMPTYQIDSHIPSHNLSYYALRDILHLGLNETMGILFGYFLCFFILLLCFGVNPWISIAGALAMGMSSYFFLLIPAGHVTKAMALGFLPAIIGGIHLVFKQKYWLGIPIMLIFGIVSITLHPQMTYYVAMLIGVMTIAEIVIKIKDLEWKNLGISLAVCIACLALVAGTRICYLQLNNEYLHETMRGGHSELTQNDTTSTSKVGLDLTYATDWSYGRAETMTLLIPNWEGGASGYNVGKDSQLCRTMRKQGVPKRDAEQFCRQAPTYHGEKAFTSGPVYVGAIVCFLFLLGLLIVPGPYKWGLLFATLMSIFLAWGKNMMWLTEWFFNYFPMYNKFRAVESILIVAEITMPLLGFMGLQRIVEGKVAWPRLRVSMLIAGGVTAALCLYTALFAGGFDMSSTYDAQWTDRMPEWLTRAIMNERVEMVKADAWRSLMFVLLGFVLTYWYAWYNKDSKEHKLSAVLYVGLAIMILADMVPVDRRFFGEDNFVSKREFDNYFAMQPYEEEILQDTTLNYRVLNLTTSTFNDSRTSYRLKSIGGYHAAKLRRYQDLIEAHLVPEMNPFYQTIFRTNGFMMPDEKNGGDFPVLNMLNMRYAVVSMQDGSQAPIRNPYAMGNAWFVNQVQFVPTPDDESAALNTIDLHTTAVADERFRDVLTCQAQPDSTDAIELTTYTPNRLEYHTRCSHDRVAVFSEVYYPHGWHLYVDGEERELGRANYVLRAGIIPAGEHTVKMEFVPDALAWDKLGYALVIIAILISLGCICLSLRYYFASRKNATKA
ncbi:MAG: hypothetical protein IKP93_04750 [Paludibacteraceae bacterium]|nr:hypothetical protein [Paludibacteraceae bacterium]